MLVIAAIYFAPTMIALALRVRGFGWVLATNLLFGWTGIGWLAALGLTLIFRSIDRFEDGKRTEAERSQLIAEQFEWDYQQRERALEKLDELLSKRSS